MGEEGRPFERTGYLIFEGWSGCVAWFFVCCSFGLIVKEKKILETKRFEIGGRGWIRAVVL